MEKVNQPKTPTVLVIEDDPDIQFAVRLILDSAGYSVKAALNGEEALSLIENEALPDLILLDMLMPVMDGWQFAREFRARHDRKAPIVVMTAASDAARRSADVMADGFISKPFDVDDFLRVVRSHTLPALARHAA